MKQQVNDVEIQIGDLKTEIENYTPPAKSFNINDLVIDANPNLKLSVQDNKLTVGIKVRLIWSTMIIKNQCNKFQVKILEKNVMDFGFATPGIQGVFN